jgi:cell shape-determining protein MreC
LSSRELASSEIQLQREQLTEVAADSRRLDWYQKHEKEIKDILGLDPNNDWSYDNNDDALSEPDADPPDI